MEGPPNDKNNSWGQLALLVCEKYPTHGFPRDQWEQMTASSFENLVRQFRVTQQEYQDACGKPFYQEFGSCVFRRSEATC